MKLFVSHLVLFLSFQSAFSQSLLWKIEKDGSPYVSYLYGTMHVKDSRVFQFSDSLTPAIQNCEFFAMEIHMDSVKPKNMMSFMMIQDGKSLKDFYSKKQYKKLEKKFKEKTGFQLGLFSRMKPLFVQSMVAEKGFNTSEKNFLDMHLMNLAKEAEKKIIGLEKVDDQLKALDAMPFEYQIKSLYETVVLDKKDSNDEDMVKKMLDLYVNAQLDELFLLFDKMEYNQDYLKKLLDDRNVVMANKISEYAEKSTLFSAIGAAHLPGKNGVIQLLKNHGFKVSPIK